MTSESSWKKAICPYTVNERWAFLDMAAEKANESKCDRGAVGAALVGPGGKLIHVACNEVSPGHGDHTCKDFCPRGAKTFDEQPSYAPYDDCNALHAEFSVVQAALIQEKLDYSPENERDILEFFRGYWMFITREPCDACKMYLQGLRIRYQFATSWQRRVVREGVLKVVAPTGEGSGDAS